MAAPSNNEQYLLELINDARLNPMGNAARYITSYSPLKSSNADIQSALDFFHVNGSTLQSAYAALKAVQPLAWNSNLNAAAAGHNAKMIATHTQFHEQGDAFKAQFDNAGYTGWSNIGENVYTASKSPLYAHAGFMVDWGNASTGHRDNIMSVNFREVGISITTAPVSGVIGPQVTTEDFGNRFAAGQFILGVAYNDTNKDNFYTPGEGLGTLQVKVGSTTATSAASGGYTLETALSGAQNVTLSGAGLASAVTVALDLVSKSNVKLDVVGGNTLKTSTSVTVTGPITYLTGLGLTGLTLNAVSSNSHTITGTSGNDTLAAGSGNDVLNGGSGNDKMTGGLGNDTYYVNTTSDSIVESSSTSAGTDTVQSSITYTLASGLENLTLTGSSAINGTGNSLNNILRGDASSGVNTLTGLAGNDIYVVGTGDKVVEAVSGGTDTVQSAVTHTLAVNVENLTLSGSSAVNGTGNASSNVLTGNTASNTLNGLAGSDTLNGGLGNDTLTGGANADNFVFNTALNAASNRDTITDFVAEDTIRLENAIFTALTTTGTLASGAFYAAAGATAAHDADDRIIYNTTTGALYYDANGTGSGAAVQFATLSTHPGLTNADIVVI